MQDALCLDCGEEVSGKFCNECGASLTIPLDQFIPLLKKRFEERAYEDFDGELQEASLGEYREALNAPLSQFQGAVGRESSYGILKLAYLALFLQADGLSIDKIKALIDEAHNALWQNPSLSVSEYQLNVYLVYEKGCEADTRAAIKAMQKEQAKENVARYKQHDSSTAILVHMIDIDAIDNLGVSPDLTRREIKTSIMQIDCVQERAATKAEMAWSAFDLFTSDNEIIQFLRVQLRLTYDTSVLARTISKDRIGGAEYMTFFGGCAAVTGPLKGFEQKVTGGVSVLPDILNMVDGEKVWSMMALTVPMTLVALVIHWFYRFLSEEQVDFKKTWTAVIFSTLMYAPYSMIMSIIAFNSYQQDDLHLVFLPVVVVLWVIVYASPLLSRLHKVSGLKSTLGLSVIALAFLLPTMAVTASMGLLPTSRASVAAGQPQGDGLVQEGVALYQNGQYQEAEAKFREALAKGDSITPKSSIYTFIGNCYLQQKQYSKAKTEYYLALEADPKQGLAWLNLGKMARQSRDYSEAEHFYKMGIKLDAKNAQLESSLGATYYFQNQHKRALEHYHRALTLDPQDAVTYANASVAYLALGDVKKAQEALNKAKELGYANAAGVQKRIDGAKAKPGKETTEPK